MLPTVSKGRGPASASSSRPPNPAFPHYLRRIVKWQQMDIEYTFWQMFHLCTSPKVVYQHTKYHKQTKNQWARDDPAFVVICSLLLAVSTLAYCAAYDHSAGHALFVVISILLFHFLFTGVLIATCCWFLTNNYLREEVPNSHVVEQRVEWYSLVFTYQESLIFLLLEMLECLSGLIYLMLRLLFLCKSCNYPDGSILLPRLYAFDVHCNSFFPMFVLLYVIHYFLSPLLLVHGFIPVLLSNLLFMVAISYYHYLNFLGYDVLPFLERTTFFLYPIGIFIILTPIFILSGFNPSRYAMNIYFSRHL